MWTKVLLYTLTNRVALLLTLILILFSMSVSARADSTQNVAQSTQFQKAVEYLYQFPFESLSLAAVPFCYRYTCRVRETIQIPEADWAHATRILSVRPESAQMERALLSEVVSRIEIMVARITATQYDIGGTFKVDEKPKVYSAQLDCVDEASNMHMYLHLLNNTNKLHWHRVGELVHRGWLLDFSYPHTALTIIENGSNEQYVIDSWFHDSGRPPEVLSLQQWKSGWTPADF